MKIDGVAKLVVESVLRAVIEGTTPNLKTLHVHLEEGPDSTDAALLSQAALKVEKFSVTGSQASQVQAILTAVSQSEDIALKDLHLGDDPDDFIDLSGVSPDILGRAAVKLETLTGRARLSSAQLEEIFTRLATTGQSQLRELDVADIVGDTDLSHMDPEILTGALVKLKTTSWILFNVLLSSEQVTHLFTKISNTEDLRLTKVDLSWPPPVSQVPPAVLTGAISRLEEVGFGGSDLTPVQLEAIFTMMANQQPEGSKLKMLGFLGHDLSGISPELLLGAIRTLEKLMLFETTLDVVQVNAILCLVTEGPRGRLNKITIWHPKILGTICPDLRQAANQAGHLLKMVLG